MHSSRKSVIPFLLFALVLLVSLACGSSTPTTAPANSNSTAPTSGTSQQNQNPAPTEVKASSVPPTEVPPTALPPTATQPPEYFLGDAIQTDGYAITALSVADPATPGMLYQAEAGKKLVAVEVVVSNVSGDALSVNPLNSTLVDDGGFVYQTELGGVDGQISAMVINKGEQVRGWLSFKIPEGAKAATLKYSFDFLGSDMLQVPLTPAPADHTPITVAVTPNSPTSKLGETVEQSGYSLSAITVEDPTTPGMFYTQKQGYKLVAVEFVVGNVSATEALSVNPLYAYLVDSNGFVYSVELLGRDGQIDTLDLNTGEKAQGWVSFTIPENATPSYIKYELQFFTGDSMMTGLAK
jgi:hypothetical protein